MHELDQVVIHERVVQVVIRHEGLEVGAGANGNGMAGTREAFSERNVGLHVSAGADSDDKRIHVRVCDGVTKTDCVFPVV